MEEHLILEKAIDKGDFSRGGEASSELKSLLRKLGIDNTVIRRAAIVTYELEMNIIIHSDGGSIGVAVSSNEIIIYIDDKGPGIEDLERAFQPGYSTASDEVREMGFGAGMGLVNVKNYSDELEIDTCPGEGTSIKVVISIK